MSLFTPKIPGHRLIIDIDNYDSTLHKNTLIDAIKYCVNVNGCGVTYINGKYYVSKSLIPIVSNQSDFAYIYLNYTE
jgi:hypothetical protein